MTRPCACACRKCKPRAPSHSAGGKYEVVKFYTPPHCGRGFKGCQA